MAKIGAKFGPAEATHRTQQLLQTCAAMEAITRALDAPRAQRPPGSFGDVLRTAILALSDDERDALFAWLGRTKLPRRFWKTIGHNVAQ